MVPGLIRAKIIDNVPRVWSAAKVIEALPETFVESCARANESPAWYGGVSPHSSPSLTNSEYRVLVLLL